MRVLRPGHREHYRWHRAYRPKRSPVQLEWTSKPTQSDGDLSSVFRPPVVLDLRAFSISVESAPTSTVTVNLLQNGSTIATATIPSGEDTSDTDSVTVRIQPRDALRLELATLADAGLPVHGYLEFVTK